MLSAIVPTHNRPDLLTQCLETLMAQDVGPDELEIVVVDDGSRDDLHTVVVAASANRRFATHCERQPPSGLNVARNRGAGVARGEVLAFLDDDTLVDTGWARALVEAFESYPCAGVGGRVRLGLTGGLPQWVGEEERTMLTEYELGDEGRWLDLADGRWWLAEDPPPVGANCAVRRTEFVRVGGFLPGLDRRGRSLVSNGDSEFFLRLYARGGRLRYEPRASVTHCVPDERMTIPFFIRRHYAQGVSAELMAAIDGQVPDPARLTGLFRGLGGAGKVLCRDRIHGRSTIRGRFLAAYWTGRLLGRARARLFRNGRAATGTFPDAPSAR